MQEVQKTDSWFYSSETKMNKLALTLFFFNFILLNFIDAAYDESFAKNKALPLAGAAYSSKPEECLANKFQNAKLQGKYEVKCDGFKGDTCFGFTAVSHTDKAIIVAFRGSTGFIEIVAEGVESIFDKKSNSPIGGEVSLFCNLKI